MQVDPQHYLDLLENSGRLMVWDTESQGLEGDYGRLYVVTAKLFGQDPVTFSIGENMSDKGLAKEARDFLNTADCWVTFYGKGHDVPLMNTRLTRWGYDPLASKHHIDMFFVLVRKLKMARKSQAHVLEFLEDTMEELGVPVRQKMTVSPNVWSDLPARYARNIRILKERCESDTEGLETLYRLTRKLIKDVKKG